MGKKTSRLLKPSVRETMRRNTLLLLHPTRAVARPTRLGETIRAILVNAAYRVYTNNGGNDENMTVTRTMRFPSFSTSYQHTLSRLHLQNSK